MLLDYSGATQLNERLSKLRNCLEMCDDKKESIDKFKATVDEKLDFIASKVSNFEKLQKLTTEKYSYEYLKLKKSGEALHNELEDNENMRKTLLINLNEIKVKKTNYLRQHEENLTKIKELESGLFALKDKRKMYKDFVDMNLLTETKALQDDQNMNYYREAYELNYEDIDKTPEELKKTLKGVLKEKDRAAAKVQEYSDQLNEVQTEYFNEKKDYDLLNDELNKLSLKRIGFKSEKDRKKYYEDEITKVIEEIMILERDLDIETKNKDKNIELQKTLISKIDEIKSDLEEKKREEAKVKLELDPSRKRQENLSQIQKMNFGLNEKKIERDENQRKMERIEEIIESADKKFKTVKRLLKKIDEADISGFHGVFIDLIDIDERIEFSVDIALRNKMFVFVVDTVAAAEKIMNLNKEIKGGVIS